jgi:20S proteasome alpha/beta subunit
MTVVVAIFCSDGVVIAADSMITPSIGGISVGHHHGMKISVLAGQQLFAFAGDQGQSDRVRIMADGGHATIAGRAHAIDYPLAITQGIVQQFQNTGIANAINTNPILSFVHQDKYVCCVFEGAMQPRLLDAAHYYVAVGSGKLSADPFLRFVTDVFCNGSQPSVAEGVFLAAWTVQHVIDVNPGGVAGPIRVGVLREEGGAKLARLLNNTEIAEHQQAVESAVSALRQWRDSMRGIAVVDEVLPEQPAAPAQS